MFHVLLDILSHSLTLPLSSYLSQDHAKTFGGMKYGIPQSNAEDRHMVVDRY